ARPASARQSVAKSGANVVPSTMSVAHCSNICDTGGDKYGMTGYARVTSSHARSTTPTDTARVNAVDQRNCSVSERMPGHDAIQSYDVQSVQQVADEREIEHHREHRIVRAHAAVREDQIAEAGL